ncbi:MAG: 3-oxoacyl-[acyl-carrier-protein] synthase III C-terminal domain-containing protein [Myxococcota bacterium]
MSDAFITHTASMLPGPPVGNDAMEAILGVLEEGRGKLRQRVLNNNGIRARHYALDPVTGEPTHTLAQLQAEAIRTLLDRAGLDVEAIDLLVCGCSIPDVIAPGIASLVHGELGGRPIEVASTAGICGASIAALKYGSMAVRTGESRCAVVGAAERLSVQLRARHFGAELRARRSDEDDPHVALGAEFLRWMLSDGAGAVLIRDRPSETGLSFKVEWVQSVSFAHDLPTCMYMGGERLEDGSLRSWRDCDDLGDAVRQGYFNLQQDVRLLAENIIPVSTGRTIARIREDRQLTPEMVDWVLPHFSSNLFRDRAFEAFAEAGFEVPDERVRSNLVERGNMGSASIFVMLDDLVASGELEPGHGVLLVVPESGRFNTGYALLRAVGS